MCAGSPWSEPAAVGIDDRVGWTPNAEAKHLISVPQRCGHDVVFLIVAEDVVVGSGVFVDATAVHPALPSCGGVRGVKDPGVAVKTCQRTPGDAFEVNTERCDTEDVGSQ